MKPTHLSLVQPAPPPALPRGYVFQVEVAEGILAWLELLKHGRNGLAAVHATEDVLNLIFGHADALEEEIAELKAELARARGDA